MRCMGGRLGAGLLAGILCVGFFSARPAFARSVCVVGGTVSPAVTRQAEVHYEEGRRAAELGQWEEARVSYTRACKLMEDYKILANLGSVELRLGWYVNAAEHLRHFLRIAPLGISEGARSMGEAKLREAQARVGTVTVRVLEPGIEIVVNGESVGRTPLREPLFVRPGLTVFYARAEGYMTDRVVRSIDAGSTLEVALAPRKQTETASEAERYVTGLPITQSEKRALRSAPEPTFWMPAAVGSLVAAGTGVGLLVGLAALPRRDPAYDTAQTALANGAVYSLVGAGALLGLSLAVQPSSRRSEAAASRARRPSISLGVAGAGLGVTIRW